MILVRVASDFTHRLLERITYGMALLGTWSCSYGKKRWMVRPDGVSRGFMKLTNGGCYVVEPLLSYDSEIMHNE